MDLNFVENKNVGYTTVWILPTTVDMTRPWIFGVLPYETMKVNFKIHFECQDVVTM